ncbi:MAG: Rieske 2Fe-2S domain-containing protein [Lapillicoccus sp.]
MTRAPSLTRILSRLVDRATSTIERAGALDPAADLVDRVASAIPAGPVKDTLSGVALGHPAHPMLVTVPIGAVTSAVVLDVLGDDQRAARRLVGLGLLSAVPAALSGLSDWSDTRGAERRVGVAHLALNAAGLGLLGASWWVRRPDAAGGPGHRAAGPVLSLAGLSLLGGSGWLGGHLSYAMGVGVDTTAFQRPATTWSDAVAADDLVEGQPVAVLVEDMSVLLVRADGVVRALADRCTHRGAPLHEGTVVDGCIECPWHASRFDLVDGSVVRGPATRPAPVFETRVVDGRVQVRRDEERTLRLNPTS